MLLTLLLTPFFPLAQDPPAPEPVTEVAEVEADVEETSPAEAAATLKESFKTKDVNVILNALENHGTTPDKKVVQAIASGVKNKERDVVLATVQALRFNPDGEALKVLLKQKKNKAIHEDDEIAAEYYWALGQHADKKALPILTENIFSTGSSQKVSRARIMSIARIREKESVEELIQLMNAKGRRGGGSPYMREIGSALTVLTGESYGADKNSWLKWWGDNKRTLKISKEEWELQGKANRQWKLHWATPDEKAEFAAQREDAREKDGAKGEDGEDGGRGKGRRGGDS